MLALGTPPQDEQAFAIGARGEEALERSLSRRTGDGPAVTLFNRRMPRGHGDIDCIAIGPSGVYVVDAKNVKGAVKIETAWFGPPRLRVGGHNRTHYLDGLDRQVAAVRTALGPEHAAIAVQGVICFLVADLPLLRTATMRGHLLLYRKALAKRINADGPLTPETIEAVARRVGTALPVA